MEIKLHIGSGAVSLPGWTNIDAQPYPGVDRLLDVRQGLPFEHVSAIFAEHFIEHLTLEEGIAFLRECRRVLSPAGVLRLSTPNLDWVWASHYRTPGSLTPDQEIQGCLELNRAFHGWGHRFLYNFSMIKKLLLDVGFGSVVRYRFGESSVPDMRGLERHELSPSFNGIDALLVVEASGSSSGSESLSSLEPYLRDFTLS